jgi:Cu(I)/Ag(I) efflux system membrane fusion protein
MNNFKINNVSILILVLAILVTAAITYYITKNTTASQTGESSEAQPLYWVAPMDPNYRRDEPGKSPMGMDLIPVYANNDDSQRANPGAISISPDVVNNIGVRTAPALMRSLNEEITTVGYVQYDQDQLVHIHPRVEGWVENLYIKAAGDPVKEGERLYDLYAPQLVNAQEELLLAANRNNARLIDAAKDRLRALQVGDEVIDNLISSGSVQQALPFYAPRSGVIDNLNIRQGFFVKPDTTLMSIGTIEQVWLEAEVYERQASLVKVGQAVSVTLDYFPGKSWQGVVDYVYPVLDQDTRTLRLRVRIDNPEEQLKPNMFAQVTIHAGRDEKFLVVPKEAVIRTGSQNRVVLALSEGRFKSVAVELGRMDDKYIEIRNGIRAGDEVVTSAQFLLDSESSKTSDFRRMDHDESESQSMDMMDHSSMDHGESGAQSMGTMDHSNMDHSESGPQSMDTMDHSSMDHSESGPQSMNTMDHSDMGHGAMNHSDMESPVTGSEPMNHDDMDHSQHMEPGND